MLRTTFASSRSLRVCALGLATLSIAVIFTTDSADARRRHKSRSHVARVSSYNPAFSSIIVDGNSGAVLSSNNPDGSRHPASLTKIMTLYMLFEKLESGKLTLDSEMDVSQHASVQAPTKLGLRPGQTLRVEDAIKALVTRSANDAAVVIAEAIAGDEDDFAKLMTKKARALGMSRTVYRNASGLPDDAQVTTARDQSVLGRAIQDRFPRYYRYFATASFNYRGRNIRNHNRLIGSVEGVDGIKTGYTRASGFNLVSSMKRGNRHLVGVVLGGRSGGARDAAMRNLLAENLDKGATRRTVAAITERNPSESATEVAEAEAQARPTDTKQVNGAIQVAAATPVAAEPLSEPPARPAAPAARPSVFAAATAALPPAAPMPQPRKPEPGPLNSGVIQSEPISTIPGSSEPMKPVRVRTVQVKSGQYKLASAGGEQPAPPAATNAITARAEPTARSPETTNSLYARSEMPRQPAGFGTGNGLLGVLPAQGSAQGGTQMAYADPAPRNVPAPQAPAPQTVQQGGAIKPAAIHTGWIIQVGALESESEARIRLDAAREQARGLLGKADPFTEAVVGKGDRKLYRARFAGLDREKAEAVCKTLKRSEISCITIKN
ncbi:serine hydrolase [Tardiphaga sp. 367_B4_N1_1]|uniref:serine hydrolase n=1 Tax=Tardiphaga sp. 367_B4_N1_1 TaxID=3240777 RepID=UPI003F207E46